MGVLESERERKRRLRSAAKTEYFDAVLSQVKFSWDHEEIENELDEHILEECVYLRARKGLDDAAAEAESLKRMGDPAALGKLLNQAHNPWIGRVWILTTVILLLAALPLCRIILWELISMDRFWEKDTQITAAESVLEKYAAEEGLFYHISCDEVLKLDTYEIRFTDVISAYDGPVENGNRLFLCYELVSEDDAGTYAVDLMDAEMFLNPDGEIAAEVGVFGNVEKPDVGEALNKHMTFYTGDNYVCIYRLDRFTKFIDVNYNVFGQKASCRIDLTEGLKQAEERLGVKTP